MNPTLSTRLRGWQQDPYWRRHPPASWPVPVEPATALLHQPLSAGAAVFEEPAGQPSAVSLPPPGAGPAAAVERRKVVIKKSPHSGIALLIGALVTLLEGWLALRDLGRQIRAIWGASAAASPAGRRRRPAAAGMAGRWPAVQVGAASGRGASKPLLVPEAP